ncbi:MAG: major facilitator superfamily domain-containing protein 1 [bacterium]|nr:major facilitator superfamily domain-containing protein 1 [bacterium]
MTEKIKQTLRDSKTARWIVLGIVSFAMLTAYLFMEAISPLKTMIQNTYGWDNGEWGIFTGAQGYLNVFAGMLIIAGIILDKLGVRLTAIASAVVMIIGGVIKYYAFSGAISPDAMIFGIKSQVFISATGFAVFCVGAEGAGITVSKILVKWFKGKELAMAMGLEMACARLGSFVALYFAPKLAANMTIATPVLFGLILLLVGLVAFIVYTMMDLKYDKEGNSVTTDDEDLFKFSDIKQIISNRGFWYIAILCVLFYSAVFPFYKYGPDFMVNKFGVDPKNAGDIPSYVPIGTMLLTPLFGFLYDRKGKGASIMILGALLLFITHLIYYMPSLTSQTAAIGAVILLGIGFSLVPSAMWPSVPKIIPDKLLGSAYALIFFIQNIGLMVVPNVLGQVLDKTNPGVADQIDQTRKLLTEQGLTPVQIGNRIQEMREAGEIPLFDYTQTWLVFLGLTVLAIVFGFLLKHEDKRKGYGLELANIQKESKTE